MIPSAPLAAMMFEFQTLTALGENWTSVMESLCSVSTTNNRKLFHENKRSRPSQPPETNIFRSGRNFTMLQPSFVMEISHFNVIWKFRSIVKICKMFEAFPHIPLPVTASKAKDVMHSRSFTWLQVFPEIKSHRITSPVSKPART